MNFGLVIIPVARNSPLSAICGASFERTVKFHRWLGRWAIITMIIHGFGLCGSYGNTWLGGKCFIC